LAESNTLTLPISCTLISHLLDMLTLILQSKLKMDGCENSIIWDRSVWLVIKITVLKGVC
jgi:hypothetical protein